VKNPPPPNFHFPDAPRRRTSIVAGIVIGMSAALLLAGVAYLASNADPRTKGSGETTGLSDQQPPPKDPNYQR
jgi:hypothetical protein